ncbi:MAG TPA: DinB family protein [Chitinophagaceae bacterium]|nr:DinB family protein [Chitinophagaceae bacterium]
METPTNELELLVKMSLMAWDAQNNALNKLLNELSDEQLQKEIAPGRNRGIYLLGHLVAVSDGMIPLMDFGEKLFPDLYPVFVKEPDNATNDLPSAAELKRDLEAVNAKLNEKIKTTTTAQWFERHTAVSPEDFAKEPHRNKLNIIINRTGHMAYHIGQMVLLK